MNTCNVRVEISIISLSTFSHGAVKNSRSLIPHDGGLRAWREPAEWAAVNRPIVCKSSVRLGSDKLSPLSDSR